MTPPASGTRRPRLLRSFLIPTAFVLAYFAARAGIESVEPRSTPALLFALLPVPAFAFFIHAYVRNVRGMDELERRIQLEALAFAFPVALLVAFTAGLLHLAGFEGEGDWDLPRLWPLLVLPYFFGLMRSRRRYV
ncbi:MAG TPA: hypothetical protein VF530_21835 [Planctomycetota bacterium]